MTSEATVINPEFRDDRVLALLSPANVLKLPLFKERLPEVFPGVDVIAPRGVEHMHEIVERSKSTHRLVLAVGGDGTLHQALRRLCLANQVLGVLPSGTGNDVARVLGFPKNIKDRIRRLAAMRALPTDFGTLNRRRFINSGGFGIDSHVLNTMRQGKGFIARNYNAAFINTLFRLPGFKGRVRFDGGDCADSFFWILAMNTPNIGGGTLIAPRAELDDGKLDLLLVRETSRLDLLKFFPAALRGAHLKLPPVVFAQVAEANVTLEEPVEYIALDGELVYCGKREIEIKAQQGLRFLR